MKLCSKCNAPITLGASDCANCGAPVTKDTAEAPVELAESTPTESPDNPVTRYAIRVAIACYLVALIMGIWVRSNNPGGMFLDMPDGGLKRMPAFWYGFMGTATFLAILAALTTLIAAVTAMLRKPRKWLLVKVALSTTALLLLPALFSTVM